MGHNLFTDMVSRSTALLFGLDRFQLFQSRPELGHFKQLVFEILLFVLKRKTLFRSEFRAVMLADMEDAGFRDLQDVAPQSIVL
jgi:hypothetical protein